MTEDKLNQLTSILSIPTYFANEELIKEYLVNYAKSKKYKVYTDKKGNVYFEKGELKKGEFFPCVCAHIDSVFFEHIELIKNNIRKIIKIKDDKIVAYHPDTLNRTGLAGDDLAGVFICLQMLEKFDKIKAAFFVEEEFGYKGSDNCDLSFFDNIGYVVQFDAPTANWFTKTLGGYEMYNKRFLNKVTPILEKHKIDNISHDPYTDILPLKKKFNFCCANLPTGYHNWHSNREYVSISEMDKCLDFALDFINNLGNKKYKYKLKNN